jgi:hypothetical protein
MWKRLWMIVGVLLLVGSFVHAQEATPEAGEGWTIEQRCVGEPVPRPEAWTFDGTILMTGYAGIHGVNDDWETPHVIVPLRAAEDSIQGDLGWGALSPDGRWYASAHGTRGTDWYSGTVVSAVDDIRVYSTITEEVYIVNPRVDENNYYGIFSSSFAQIYWQDNETIVFDGLILNPFTSAVDFYTYPDPFIAGSANPLPSPDWSHIIYWDDVSWSLYDVEQQLTITRLNLASGRLVAAWSPDSTYFLALTSQGELILFNQRGEPLETIFSGFQDYSYYTSQLSA